MTAPSHLVHVAPRGAPITPPPITRRRGALSTRTAIAARRVTGPVE